MDQLARDTRHLGAILRRMRRHAGLTQDALGKKVHLRQATISKLETGEPNTRLGTLVTVLSALDLELVVRPRTKTSEADLEDIF